MLQAVAFAPRVWASVCFNIDNFCQDICENPEEHLPSDYEGTTDECIDECLDNCEDCFENEEDIDDSIAAAACAGSCDSVEDCAQDIAEGQIEPSDIEHDATIEVISALGNTEPEIDVETNPPQSPSSEYGAPGPICSEQAAWSAGDNQRELRRESAQSEAQESQPDFYCTTPEPAACFEGNTVENAPSGGVGSTPESQGPREPVYLAQANDPNRASDAPSPNLNPQSARDKRFDPINFFSGDFVYSRCDLDAPNSGPPLRLCLSYRSRLSYDGPLGVGWTHTFNVFLAEQDRGLLRMDGDGHLQFFERLSDGSYAAPRGMPVSLQSPSAGQFILLFPDGRREVYGPQRNSQNQIMLTRMEDRFGRAFGLVYNAGRLTEVTGEWGFKIVFLYNAQNGKIWEISSGKKNIVLGYEDIDADDGEGEFALTTYSTTPTDEVPEGTTWHFGYDSGHHTDQSEAPDRDGVLAYCSNQCLQEAIPLSCEGACQEAIILCHTDCPSECVDLCSDTCPSTCSSRCDETCDQFAEACDEALEECLGEAESDCESSFPSEAMIESDCEEEIREVCQAQCQSLFSNSEAQGACEGWCDTNTSPSGCGAEVAGDIETDCHSAAVSACGGGDEGDGIPDGSECEDDCRSQFCGTCEEDCISDCPINCNAQCEGGSTPSGDSVEGVCPELEANCRDNCLLAATHEEQRDHGCRNGCFRELFIYGTVSDLNYNLLEIRDHEERLILRNEFGTNPHEPNFDRVIGQQWGEPDQRISIRYEGFDPLNNDFAPEVHAIDRNGFETIYIYNDDGNIEEKRLSGHASVGNGASLVTRYSYTQDGALQSVTYPRGNRTTYVYDDKNPNVLARGNILSISRFSSSDTITAMATSFTYEPRYNEIESIRLPEGQVTGYDWDRQGHLSKIVHPVITRPDRSRRAVTIQMIYNKDHQLSERVDPKGSVTRYLYNDRDSPTTGPPCSTEGSETGGFLRAIVHDAASPRRGFSGSPPQSLWECYGYDEEGNLTKYEDASRRLWITEPNERGLPKFVRGPMGYQIGYQYDPYDQVVRMAKSTLDPDSPPGAEKETVIHYNLLGNVDRIEEEVSEGAFHVVSMAYDRNDNLAEIEDPLFGKTVFAYNNLNKIFRETRGEGNLASSKTYSYDANGNLVTTTDGEGATITMTHDLFDRPETVNDLDGILHTFDYDDNSNLVGHDREYVLNRDGRSEVRQEGIAYEYDAMGWVKKVGTFAGPRTWAPTRIFRTPNGMVEKMIDPTGFEVRTTFDGLDRPLLTEDASKKSAKYVYNPKNQLVQMVRSAPNELTGTAVTFTEAFAHDPLGNLSTHTDPQGLKTHYTWDGEGKWIKTEYPNKSVEETGYDGLGRTVTWKKSGDGVSQRMIWSWNDPEKTLSLTDGIGSTTTHLFDPLYRLRTLTLPNGKNYSYGYDHEDRVNYWSDPEGNMVNQGYTPAGRLAERMVKRGPRTVGTTIQRFEYSGGRPIRAFDNNEPSRPDDDVTIDLNFDPMGNRTADRISYGGRVLQTSAGWDLAGNMTDMTYPTGRKVLLSRRRDGFLKGITVDNFPILSHRYTGFAVGEIAFPKTRDTLKYDKRGLLSEIRVLPADGAAPLSSLKYNYNPMRWPERITGKLGSDFVITNHHDLTGQLLKSSIEKTGPEPLPDSWTGRYRYELDGNANRGLAEYEGTRRKRIDYTVNTMSEYSRINRDEPVYDDNGNLLKRSDSEYRYDFLGRLREAASSLPLFDAGPLTGSPPTVIDGDEHGLNPGIGMVPGTDTGINRPPHLRPIRENLGTGIAAKAGISSDKYSQKKRGLFPGIFESRPSAISVAKSLSGEDTGSRYTVRVGFDQLGTGPEEVEQDEDGKLVFKVRPDIVDEINGGHAEKESQDMSESLVFEAECYLECHVVKEGIEWVFADTTRVNPKFKEDLTTGNNRLENPEPLLTLPQTGHVLVADLAEPGEKERFDRPEVVLLEMDQEGRLFRRKTLFHEALRVLVSRTLIQLESDENVSRFNEKGLSEKIGILQWHLDATGAELQAKYSASNFLPLLKEIIRPGSGWQTAAIDTAKKQADYQGDPVKKKDEGVVLKTAYIYDALDRLIRREGKDNATEWAWYGLLRTVESRQGDPRISRLEYFHGPTGIEYAIPTPAGQSTLPHPSKGWGLHHDRLGSTILLTDESSGAPLETYYYDPFGKVTAKVGNISYPSSKVGNPILFTGQLHDPASGLTLFLHRAYDSDLEMGRFLQRDPAGYSDGPNPYVYAGNAPFSLLDFLGLDSNEPTKVFIVVGERGADDPEFQRFNIAASTLEQFFWGVPGASVESVNNFKYGNEILDLINNEIAGNPGQSILVYIGHSGSASNTSNSVTGLYLKTDQGFYVEPYKAAKENAAFLSQVNPGALARTFVALLGCESAINSPNHPLGILGAFVEAGARGGVGTLDSSKFYSETGLRQRDRADRVHEAYLLSPNMVTATRTPQGYRESVFRNWPGSSVLEELPTFLSGPFRGSAFDPKQKVDQLRKALAEAVSPRQAKK